MVRGDARVVPERGERVRPRAGGLALTRGPDPHLRPDDPGTPPQAMILSGGACA
ncbi:hypothetical protein [Streptomyces sp. NPDC086182]|uniref:hypothetical protein n=1 Tax=Streptomyces sp. NPDC086182 TaxID=3155058 RepID=UPI00341B34FD